MKILLYILAVLALLGTIIPSFLVFSGLLDLDTNKNIMGVSAIIWLLTGWALMGTLTKEQENP